jgi:tRNA(Ile)-lysidine synthase
MKSIEEKVLRFIDGNKLILKNENVLVALSGGADSVFALYFLNKFKRRLGITISAVHLNHSLREFDADSDEKYCEEFCRSLNINLFKRKISIAAISKKNKTSLEETGRVERYKYFSELSKEFKFDKVVTAHHKDDNAETILLNLFRGTGIHGYSGIPFRRGNVVRPILVLSKKEILTYLNKYKISFMTDVTNFSDVHIRNIIRNQIIPLVEGKINPQWSNSLFTSSQIVNSYLELIDKRFLSRLRKKLICERDDSLYINVEELKKEEKFLITELFRKSISDKFLIELSFIDSEKIFELGISDKAGKMISLKENIVAIRNQTELEIFKHKKKIKQKVKIKVGESVQFEDGIITIITSKRNNKIFNRNKTNKVEYIDGDLIKGGFELRTWEDGDYFYPLGMEQKKKISDLLTDSKVKSSQKKNVHVLINKKRIVWVVGYRISNLFKLTKETKNILRLQLD